MKNFFFSAASFLAAVVVVLLALLGAESLRQEIKKEQKMAQLWAEFLEVPKDYRESTSATAASLVRNWETPPTAAEHELLLQEIAPRVNHIRAVNSGTEFSRSRAEEIVRQAMPACAWALAKAR